MSIELKLDEALAGNGLSIAENRMVSIIAGIYTTLCDDPIMEGLFSLGRPTRKVPSNLNWPVSDRTTDDDQGHTATAGKQPKSRLELKSEKQQDLEQRARAKENERLRQKTDINSPKFKNALSKIETAKNDMIKALQSKPRRERAEALQSAIRGLIKAVSAVTAGADGRQWRVKKVWEDAQRRGGLVQEALFGGLKGLFGLNKQPSIAQSIKDIAGTIKALNPDQRDTGLILKSIIKDLMKGNEAKFSWQTKEWQQQNLEPAIRKHIDKTMAKQRDKDQKSITYDLDKLQGSLRKDVLSATINYMRDQGYGVDTRQIGNKLEMIFSPASNDLEGHSDLHRIEAGLDRDRTADWRPAASKTQPHRRRGRQSTPTTQHDDEFKWDEEPEYQEEVRKVENMMNNYGRRKK